MSFDLRAKEWDNNPKTRERAKAFAEEIRSFFNNKQLTSAMEFGCGTGLLSFQLRNFFTNISLVDNSKGMIDVLKEKILKSGILNFKPLMLDLFDDRGEIPASDIIYSLMSMHHMLDLTKTFKAFHRLLHDGAYLCIGDLVKEDGSFHAQHKDFVGHNGFDKNELSKILIDTGFSIEYYTECYNIEKEVAGELREYPLFLMIAKKV